MQTIGVLSNLNSGKNRREPSRLDRVEHALRGVGVVCRTASLDDLEPALRQLLDAGCEYWVCDGGDGTLHWMLTVGHRLIRDRGERELPKIIPAGGGSIDFVARKVGIDGTTAEIVERLVRAVERGDAPDTKQIDTLCLRGHAAHDATVITEHIGFAGAIAGAAQRFFAQLYAFAQVDAAAIATVIARASAGFALSRVPLVRGHVPTAMASASADIFEPAAVHIEVDGQQLAFERVSTLQVGSIDICLAGVIRTFRRAAADGQLHVQALSGSPWGLIGNLPAAALGTRLWGRHRFDDAARRLRVQALSTPLEPVIDGEQLETFSTLEITLGPPLRVALV